MNKHKLTPKLQFPEFRTTWEAKRLDSFAQLITERAGDRPITPYTVTTGVGLVSQQERYGRTIAGSAFKNYYVLRTNDFAYNKSATKAYPQGYIARFRGEEGAVPNSIFTCFRVNTESINPVYVDYQFAGNLHGRWLNRFIEVSARAHGSLSIDDADLMSLPVPVPTGSSSLAEQQKIADCLSSLDDLIATEGRKLESLRAYKKGMLQQLFPHDGKTTPRLRFPEFRNKGEWEEKVVGDVFQVTRGEVLAMPLVRDEKSDDAPYPVYSSQTKYRGLAGFYSDYLYEDAITWTTDGANAGDVNYRPGKSYCTNVCGVLLSKDGHANFCVAELLNTVTRKHVSYVGNPKLMNGVMAKISIPFPKVEEQKRIAACISSLEEQMEAQSRKIVSLIQYKKGLMQQLFPSAAEE